MVESWPDNPLLPSCPRRPRSIIPRLTAQTASSVVVSVTANAFQIKAFTYICIHCIIPLDERGRRRRRRRFAPFSGIGCLKASSHCKFDHFYPIGFTTYDFWNWIFLRKFLLFFTVFFFYLWKVKDRDLFDKGVIY